ncbi:pickpocket protein 19-like [Belonocnema kinseyi]|uniref:pickpocket protein 19-like n=1 Tax=Belonocnema kinseyi TaxID=2817044 RepID=UPI00143D012B|nr:pickpocket protein 19-like [Belonocnema kinseyi]
MKRTKNFNYAGESRGKRKRAWYPPSNLVSDPKVLSIEKSEEKNPAEKRLTNPLYLWQYYCSHSSVHGMKYILDPELYTIERIIWLIIVFVSVSFTAQVIFQLATEFQAAPTVVVLESTSYKVSSLPFPSVTICPRDRVDWNKEIVYVNVTDIMYRVVPNCKDLFSFCWWRYYTQNCCQIFDLQKTEYGFCYSFNSRTSETSSISSHGLRRTSGYGDRSGLKFTVRVGNITSPPLNNVKKVANQANVSKKEKERWQDLNRGATILINHPEVWPSSGQAIASGMSISVNIKCTSGYATQDVLNLSPDKIPCRYRNIDEETEYNQETCISKCRRMHVKKHCNCNPSYFFPKTEAIECKVKDFVCLIEHNEIFTNYTIPGNTQHIEKDEPVMSCDCPPACNFSKYESNVVAIPIDKKEDIVLDVHFEGPASIRYRMHVVVTGLNLLVSFGGIFSLFLGGSILSLLEIIYTFLVGAFSLFYMCMRAKRKKIMDSRTATSEPQIYHTDFPPVVILPRRLHHLCHYLFSRGRGRAIEKYKLEPGSRPPAWPKPGTEKIPGDFCMGFFAKNKQRRIEALKTPSFSR